MISQSDVIARLEIFGYSAQESDSLAIDYSINRAAEQICASINRTDIPDGLYYTLVDMATGYFLRDLKNAGKLGENFDFSVPVTNISEGDVSVDFADTSTPEERLDVMINGLVNPPPSVFAAFRRFKW